MIIDEIKQANIEALKKHDNNLRSIYSVLMNKIMLANINARANETELTDVDVVKIIQKTIKELDEEAENCKKVGNTEEFEKIGLQRNALEKYLPTMLSKDKIKEIIMGLDDKTVPSVMRHFKTNYAGQCDMKEVSEVLTFKIIELLKLI